MKTNIFVLFFTLAVFALPAKAQDKSPSIEEIISSTDFWKLSPDPFMELYAELGFRWTSDAKESARIAGRGEKLSVRNAQIGETIITFADGIPKQIQISIFNRGDDGYLGKDEFNGELQKWYTIAWQKGQTSGRSLPAAT